LFSAYHNIEKFLDDFYEGPIPSLYLLKQPLNQLASVEESPLAFTSLDFSGTNIIVRGHVLYLKDLKFFVETLITELRESLERDLLLGLPGIIDVATWQPGIIYEEPRNTTMGYACFSDKRNPGFTSQEDILLKAVLDDPSLSGRFHFRDAANNIVWKAAPCLAYLDRCEAFEMRLFSAAHTTVGEPARGTEFASHIIRNISAGTIRNVFALFQYFTLMGTFNKSSHTTAQHSTIMRVPHPEVGRIWMMYLLVVRPIVVEWQRYFHGKRAAARAFNNLFFGHRRPATSRHLSQALSYHTSRLLGIAIPLSLYRHISTWFLNHHSVKFQEHFSLFSRAALAAQMGHSEHVHHLYASDAALPLGIDFHRFFQTMKTSGIWHELLGFEPQLARAMTNGDNHSGIYQANNYSLIPALPNHAGTGLAEEIKALLLPDILRYQSLTRANDLASLLQALGIKLQPEVVSHPRSITKHLNPTRLCDLRRFLRNPSARFKTPQQAEAVEVLASGDPSVLIVGPTGMDVFIHTLKSRTKPAFRIRQNSSNHAQRILL
jgi:hypothetical protein